VDGLRSRPLSAQQLYTRSFMFAPATPSHATHLELQLQPAAQEDGGEGGGTHLDSPRLGKRRHHVAGDVCEQQAGAQHAHHARHSQLVCWSGWQGCVCELWKVGAGVVLEKGWAHKACRYSTTKKTTTTGNRLKPTTHPACDFRSQDRGSPDQDRAEGSVSRQPDRSHAEVQHWGLTRLAESRQR